MSWVLSVDFGTSSTSAAMGRDGGAQLVAVDGGLPRMLSNVFWHQSSGQLLLGDVADNASATMPWCYEPCPKRKLGQEFLLLGDERVRVSDAVGSILHSVAQDATRMQGGERQADVRLTHPVRWGAERRKALVEAAAFAGLEEPELVLEPVAAAMHYASERLRPGEHVAVYDLGGGTFDTAVLQRTETGFEVVGVPGGRNGFGGEEFDDRLYRFLGEQLPEDEWLRLRSKAEADEDTAWPKANRQFQRNVRRAKELLTKTPQVDVLVPSPVNRERVLTAGELNALIGADVDDSVAELERTITSAGLEPAQLSAIYLAGGSSQIPLVARTITERLGIVPAYLNDPKAVICLGAALGAPNGHRNGGAAAGSNGAATDAIERPAEVAATAVGLAAGSEATAIAEPEPTAIAEPEPTAIAEPEPTAIAEPEPTAIAEPEPTAIAEPEPTAIAEPEPTAIAEPEPAAVAPPPFTPPWTPTEAAPSRRNGRAIAATAGVIIALVAVAAVLLTQGKSGGKTNDGGGIQTAASGPVTITHPASWITASEVAGSFALGGGSTGSSSSAPIQLLSGKLSLAAGQLKDSAPTPGAVPPALVARYGHETSAANALVAGAKGREYTWAPAGERLVAYVLPTAAADIAIICQAPFAGAADLGSCAALAQRAKISSAHVLAPGPDLAAGVTLNRQLHPVLSARSSLHGLTGSSLSARATKAGRVAIAESAAAASIASASTPVRYHALVASLTAALKKEASEFNRLASAARAGDRAAYSAHVHGIASESRALQAATNAFGPTGMRVRALGTLSLDGPPALPAPAAPTASPAPTQTPSTPAPSTPTPSAPSSPAPSPPAPTPTPPPSSGGCSGTCTTPFH